MGDPKNKLKSQYFLRERRSFRWCQSKLHLNIFSCEKNMWKTHKNHVFWVEIKIELKGSIAFLKTFYMPFSNLKNSYYFQRYIQKLKNSYIIKTVISRKLYHGSFSNFDNPQFIKFTNFYCSQLFFLSLIVSEIYPC